MPTTSQLSAGGGRADAGPVTAVACEEENGEEGNANGENGAVEEGPSAGGGPAGKACG